MPFEITYTSATRPTDLPEGATVKEVSSLPLQFATETHGYIVDVSRSVIVNGGVYLDVCSAHLTVDETRQVRDALNELIGDAVATGWDGRSEPPADVVEIEDKDGDRWYRVKTDRWSTDKESAFGDPWSWPARYGPHTIVRRK